MQILTRWLLEFSLWDNVSELLPVHTKVKSYFLFQLASYSVSNQLIIFFNNFLSTWKGSLFEPCYLYQYLVFSQEKFLKLVWSTGSIEVEIKKVKCQAKITFCHFSFKSLHVNVKLDNKKCIMFTFSFDPKRWKLHSVFKKRVVK